MSLKKLRVLPVLVFVVFTIESGSCVTDLYDASGIITSPNYPFDYPSNIDRAWLIHVTPGNSIRLTFLNFNLELESFLGCQYDYVEVREDSRYGTSLTGQLCGTGGLSRTVTSTSSLYIIFHSDNTRQYSGFRAEYVQSVSGSRPTADFCSFTYGPWKYCTYGCCYSSNDCCTSSSSSSSGHSSSSSSSGHSSSSSSSGHSSSSFSSGYSSSNDDNSHFMKGWVVAVIVGSCVVALSIISCILCCTVAASRSPTTTTTTVRSPPAQPSVTVVSTAQQGTATAQPVAAYPTHYAPPGAMTPPYYYNNAAYPPQDTAGSSKHP